MKTIYKISSYINRKATNGTFLGGNAASNGQVDLSNYYTKSQLQTEGLAVVDFYNIKNAWHNDMLGLEGGAVADNSSGESSGYAGEYYHFDFYNWDRLMYLNFSMSLVEDVNNIVTLVNDETSPGVLKVYGTDVSGTKGWYDIVEASSGNIVVDQYWTENSNGYALDLISTFSALNIYASNPGQYLTIQADGMYTSDGTAHHFLFQTGATTGIDQVTGDVTITTGDANHDGCWPGSVCIFAGNGNGSDSDRGDVYFGNKSVGYLPVAEALDVGIVTYNPDTGKLSYTLSEDWSGGTGGGVALTGSTNNTVCTVTGADAIQGEANLTYDGTDLTNSAGDMYADNFVLNSDRRLKTQIKSYKAEELIINYKQFELKSDIGQQRFGVIAQEVQKLYPDLVREGLNGHLAVSYIDLFVREIANLKDRIKELESR